MIKYNFIKITVVSITCFLLFFVICTILIRNKVVKDNQKGVINSFQCLIKNAQKEDGILVIPDYFFYPISSHFRYYDMLKILQNKKGIKKIYFKGDSSINFEKPVMDYFSSVTDLNELSIEVAIFRGNVFSSLYNKAGLRFLSLDRCYFDRESCNSLSQMDKLVIFMITTPVDVSYLEDGSKYLVDMNYNTRENIINSLCCLKNLKLLVLDDPFWAWSDKLHQELPNTKIILYSRNKNNSDVYTEIKKIMECCCHEITPPSEKQKPNTQTDKNDVYFSNIKYTSGNVVNEVKYEYDTNGLLAKEYQNPSGSVTASSLYTGYTYDTILIALEFSVL